MRYRRLVTIQSPTEVRSATGVVTHEWTDEETDVPATIVTSTNESRATDMAVVVDRYDVVMAGPHANVRPSWSIVDDDGARYDVEATEVLLGGRQTRVVARLVATPSPADDGGS